MKPELHVTLQVDAIEDIAMGKGENGYSVLRRVFRERLADFLKRHPEVTINGSFDFMLSQVLLMAKLGN